jgi:hypothetical protein
MSYNSWCEHECKNSEHLQADIFVNIYLYIRVLVILHNEILHKYEFGQGHCVDLNRRSPKKFSLPFLDIPTSFYEFWKFECYLNKKETVLKTVHSAGPSPARDYGPRGRQPATTVPR